MYNFVVVAGDQVVGNYALLDSAKAKLDTYPSGGSHPSRLIAEVVDKVVNSDPHVVGGEPQGSGVSAGFNKWWSAWPDINRMIAIAQAHVDANPDDFTGPAIEPAGMYFIVVAGDAVVEEYDTVEEARQKLLDWPTDASSPSRLIAWVLDGKVQKDPHSIAGEPQGGGPAEGFNKWWSAWPDINRMLAIAREHVAAHPHPAEPEQPPPPQPAANFFVVVANKRVVGVYKTVEEARQKLLEWKEAIAWPSRLIAEVKDGQVEKDPHEVGGQPQGQGPEGGFNKFWHGWPDINEMIAAAQEYVSKMPAYVEPAKPVAPVESVKPVAPVESVVDDGYGAILPPPESNGAPTTSTDGPASSGVFGSIMGFLKKIKTGVCSQSWVQSIMGWVKGTTTCKFVSLLAITLIAVGAYNTFSNDNGRAVTNVNN